MPQSNQNKYAQLEEKEQNDAQPEDHRPRDEAAQQTVTIALPPEVPTSPQTEPTRNKKYNTKAAFVTGVLQICAWVVLVIFGIIMMSFIVNPGENPHYWITNFVPGVLYLIAGIFGVVSRNRNTCVIIAYMVLCIVSAVGAGIAVIVGAVITNTVYSHCYYWNNIAQATEWTWDGCHKGEYEAIMAGTIISCITCFAELIIAIVAASFCCAGICGRCSTPTQTGVVTYAPVAPGGQVYGQVVMMVPTQGTTPPQYSLQQNPTVVHGQATA